MKEWKGKMEVDGIGSEGGRGKDVLVKEYLIDYL